MWKCSLYSPAGILRLGRWTLPVAVHSRGVTHKSVPNRRQAPCSSACGSLCGVRWCFFDSHPSCIKGNTVRDHLSSSVCVAVLAKPSQQNHSKAAAATILYCEYFRDAGDAFYRQVRNKSSAFNSTCLKSIVATAERHKGHGTLGKSELISI